MQVRVLTCSTRLLLSTRLPSGSSRSKVKDVTFRSRCTWCNRSSKTSCEHRKKSLSSCRVRWSRSFPHSLPCCTSPGLDFILAFAGVCFFILNVGSRLLLHQSHVESENLRSCMHALKEEKAAAMASLAALADSNSGQRFGRAAEEEELLSTRAELTHAHEEVR
jgi:hypothetical protein